MTVHANAEKTPEHFPPLTEQSFLSVDSSYRHQLRLGLLPWVLTAIPLWLFLETIAESWQASSRLAIAAGPVVIIALLMLIWVPRRFRFTGYCIREHDLHLRTGALFQQTLSITLNRIQHLELTKGPLERMLGLSSLAIYTAGGAGRDLAIPGLDTDTAERLREYLLEKIRASRGPITDADTVLPEPADTDEPHAGT